MDRLLKKKLLEDEFLRTSLSDSCCGNPAIRRAYAAAVFGNTSTSTDENRDGFTLSLEEVLQPTDRPDLFPYQVELVSDLIAFVKKGGGGHSSAMVSLPTGGGKTRVAVWASIELIREESLERIVWIAPDNILLEQAIDTFRNLWQFSATDKSLALFGRNQHEKWKASLKPAIIFLTPHVIYRRVALKRLNPQLIIFDEAHQAVAPTFHRGVEQLLRSSDACTLIGLSATPMRSDVAEGEWLNNLFSYNLLTSKRLGANPVKTLIHDGVLAKLEFREIEVGESQGQSYASNRFRAALSKAIELSAKERLIIFAESVKQAHAFWACLQDEGIKGAVVSAQDSPAERFLKLSKFERGEINVLLNMRLLATGYDCPAVSNLLLAGKITSRILFEQIVGRVIRGPKVGGASSGTVWELDDHLKIHGFPSSYRFVRGTSWKA